MFVYIVYVDDCNEEDCGCHLESVDSVWLNEADAIKQAENVYHGRCEKAEVQ